jgi:predicted anti-sigma-YlaC factor YlaD
MTLSCKEAARLVSEGLDRELPPEERLRLHAHLAICRGCRSIGERMAFLRRAVKKISERGGPGES